MDPMRVVSRFLAGASFVVSVAVAGCHSAAPDAISIARVATEAAWTVESGAPGQKRLVAWSVHVSDSVPHARDVSVAAERRLGVRASVPADSFHQSLDIISARSDGTTIELVVEVSRLARCGPTWGSTFGFSGEYRVRGHVSGERPILESATPLIFGDPGVCTVPQDQPSPPEQPGT